MARKVRPNPGASLGKILVVGAVVWAGYQALKSANEIPIAPATKKP